MELVAIYIVAIQVIIVFAPVMNGAGGNLVAIQVITVFAPILNGGKFIYIDR